SFTLRSKMLNAMPGHDAHAVITSVNTAAAVAVRPAVQNPASAASKRFHQVRNANAITTGAMAIAEYATATPSPSAAPEHSTTTRWRRPYPASTASHAARATRNTDI